jgi:molecular chaperone Hsp33
LQEERGSHGKLKAACQKVLPDAMWAFTYCLALLAHVGPPTTRLSTRRAHPTLLRTPSSGDELLSCISADGSVSAKAVVVTELVESVTSAQGCLPLASAALGRALICGLLCADGLKGDESVQLRFNGDGPLRGVLAIANGALKVKGYVGNAKVTLNLKPNGKLDVGAGVGKGQLFVVRTKQLPGEEQPSVYSSITELQSGEVAEDVNYYLAESEQKQGALAAGVFVDTDGGERSGVLAACGWQVQLLPFADELAVARLEQNLQALAGLSPTKMVQAGMRPQQILEALLDGMSPEFFEARAPTLQECCSEERVWRTLALLPRSEVAEILRDNEEIEVRCEFCTTTRKLAPDAIRERLAL